MLRTALSIAFVSVAVALPAQETGWIQDFAAAKAKAKAENKHLLLDFTGSDWCSWCIRLDKEVFSQEAFTAAAPKDFVLVKLDYPNDESLVTAEVKEQNAKLQEQYGIRGYPTILLADAAGRPYAQTGYERGGAEKYVEMLTGMKKRGDAFIAAMLRAEQKQGAERATALDEALAALDEEVVGNHHLETMQEIVKLDADGKANLKAKYEPKIEQLAAAKDLDREAQALSKAIGPFMQAGEADKALAHLDGVIQAPKNKAQHQLALYFKGMVIMDSTEDAKAAIAALEAAKAILPSSPLVQQIDMVLPQIRKQLEKGGEEKDGEEKGGEEKQEGGN
ncbi:MAG: thioredoxin family protein [Planctomycetes bacterium]|nr:thioredoxin family protein [Planctomycetota bacterium]